MNEQSNVAVNPNTFLHENVIDLAFDCERLRTLLSEWMRDVMMLIQVDNSGVSHIQPVKYSNFGLWVKHKAPFYWKDRDEVDTLVVLLESMDAIIEALKNNQDSLNTIDILKCLNDSVTHAIWLLGDLAKEIVEEVKGKGAYNYQLNIQKGYLDAVLKYETQLSLESGMVYAVIQTEIDLSQNQAELAQCMIQTRDILIKTVSAGDFIFQDEDQQFCLVLVDVTEKITGQLVEKMQAKVKEKLNITLHCGIAFHDGQSDAYQQVIEESKQALAGSK